MQEIFTENTGIYVRINHLYFYKNITELSTPVDNFVDNLFRKDDLKWHLKKKS